MKYISLKSPINEDMARIKKGFSQQVISITITTMEHTTLK